MTGGGGGSGAVGGGGAGGEGGRSVVFCRVSARGAKVSPPAGGGCFGGGGLVGGGESTPTSPARGAGEAVHVSIAAAHAVRHASVTPGKTPGLAPPGVEVSPSAGGGLFGGGRGATLRLPARGAGSGGDEAMSVSSECMHMSSRASASPGGGAFEGSAVFSHCFTCAEAMDQAVSQPSSHAAVSLAERARGGEPRGAPSAGCAASVRVSRLPSHSIAVSVLERPAIANPLPGFAA